MLNLGFCNGCGLNSATEGGTQFGSVKKLRIVIFEVAKFLTCFTQKSVETRVTLPGPGILV